MVGSSVEFLRFARRKVIVLAWVSDGRSFFDDGGVDTEETARGRWAGKKKRGCRREGGDEGRGRKRVHCSLLCVLLSLPPR